LFCAVVTSRQHRLKQDGDKKVPTDILRQHPPPPRFAHQAAGQGKGGEKRVLQISAGAARLEAELAATATADRIWHALPLFGVAEPWGEAIHFEIPVVSGRDRTARLQAKLGDVCFWGEERRVLVAYGATPISRTGEIRMPSPVNVFATVIGDVGVLRRVRVGEKVTMSRKVTRPETSNSS